LSDEKKENRGSDEKMDSFDLKNMYIVSNFGICKFSKG
jgi:hypothetical protein